MALKEKKIETNVFLANWQFSIEFRNNLQLSHSLNDLQFLPLFVDFTHILNYFQVK